MKERRYLTAAVITMVVSFAILSLVFGRQGSAQARRVVTDVAVCDVLEVFRNYERAGDLTQEMQQRRDDIVAGRETRIAEIDAERKELEAYRPGSPEYEPQLRLVQRKIIETNAWEEYQMAMAGHEHHRQMTEMYDEIMAMAKTIADERGHKIVLFRESPDTQTQDMQELLSQIEARKVLYASPEVDLTDIVVDRLNSQYDGGN